MATGRFVRILFFVPDGEYTKTCGDARMHLHPTCLRFGGPGRAVPSLHLVGVFGAHELAELSEANCRKVYEELNPQPEMKLELAIVKADPPKVERHASPSVGASRRGRGKSLSASASRSRSRSRPR